jgi:ectoine utilization protein EutC
MPEIAVLTEADLRATVALDGDAVSIVEQAFAALAGGGVVMPPILSMAIEEANGEVDVKTAYVPGLDGFAIKVSPGFFDNPKRGLPSLNGLMILLSAQTGIVQAVLLDNGYLTDIRTAAAGAVAASHLAPARIDTAGVIGAGLQAELQMRALALVRDFGRVLVWARDPAKAAAYAERLSRLLGRPVVVADSAEACVRDSQVVVTTTPARGPLIEPAWLHPGLHITAMGSDSAEKNELDPGVVVAADRFVCDRRSQSEVVGELRAVRAAGIADDAFEVEEIGAICAGMRPGREDEAAVTVCDLTGTGVQDTAIATHAFRVARAKGMGQMIES